jgi:hypothetical protein
LIYIGEIQICKNCNTCFAAVHYIGPVKATHV